MACIFPEALVVHVQPACTHDQRAVQDETDEETAETENEKAKDREKVDRDPIA